MMNKLNYVQHLLDILAYDTLIDFLSIADRYWLHREIIANNNNVLQDAIVSTASGEVMSMSANLITRKWQRPELRYNSDRELEITEDNQITWRKFNPEHFV